MTDRRLHRHHLSADVSSALMPDGTLWVHAATLGTRVKGAHAFTIDRAAIENFVRVFATGYPQKVPMDYDHALTSDDPEVRKLRAQGKVPKAGDVLEVSGVFDAKDLNAEMLKQVTAAGRQPDDPRNLGLWTRVRPTPAALQKIQSGEYTELSITFDENYPSDETGDGQGPTLLALALTNYPFLDDLIPIAASRDRDGGDPAAPGRHTESTMANKLMLSLAALLGKPVANEDEGATELDRLRTEYQGQHVELTQLRDFRKVVGAELEADDTVKAVAKITELKRSATAGAEAAAAARKDADASYAETVVAAHKDILTVPTREFFKTQLTRELAGGAERGKSETENALSAMKASGTVKSPAAEGQQSVAGDPIDTDQDALIDQYAKEIMTTDPELVALSKTNPNAVYPRAIAKARKKAMAGK